MRVVRHQRSVPPPLPRTHVEHDDGVRVEVVAGPQVRGEIGRWVGDRHVQVAGLDVQREGRPHGSAAHRDLLRVRPRLEPRLAGPGHRVEPPHGRAVRKAERADPALNHVLAAGRPNQHEVVEDDRRHREVLALLGVSNLPAPQQRARLGAERKQEPVRRRADDTAVLEGDPAIAIPQDVTARPPRVPPLHAAVRCVERDGAPRRRQVHRAVVHEGAGLEVVALADLEDAGRREPRDVGGVDPIEGREARAAVVVRVHEPVGRPGRPPQRLVIGAVRARNGARVPRHDIEPAAGGSAVVDTYLPAHANGCCSPGAPRAS